MTSTPAGLDSMPKEPVASPGPNRMKVRAALTGSFFAGALTMTGVAYEVMESIFAGVGPVQVAEAHHTLASVSDFPRLIPEDRCIGLFNPPAETNFPPSGDVYTNVNRLTALDIAISKLTDAKTSLETLNSDVPLLVKLLGREGILNCYTQVVNFHLPRLVRARDDYRAAIYQAASGVR